jgi:hypothetical protein
MARILHSGVSEQAKAAKHRLEDAQALVSCSRWRGAMDLAGYAVECLLKAKLMQMHRCRNLRELEDRLNEPGVFPDAATVFSHRLEPLISLTGALDRLRANPGVVVSPKFDGRRMKEKHDLIWSEIMDKLTSAEWGKVALTIGHSPKELTTF